MSIELIVALTAIGAGIFLSMVLRKFFPSLGRGPKPKSAPPPASRQEARRREREAAKRDR